MADSILTEARDEPPSHDHADMKEPLFEEFQRFRSEVDDARLYGRPVRQFATLAADLAGGAAAVLHLTMDDDNRAQSRKDQAPADLERSADSPLMHPGHLWKLQRMAAASLEQLESEAERLMEWAYEYHTPEGKRQRIRLAKALADTED